MDKLLLKQIDEFYSNSNIASEVSQLLREIGESYDSGGTKPSTNNAPILQLATLLKDEILRRKAAEEEKDRLQQHLRSSQHITHIGSWEVDLVTNKADWTNEFAEILEYEPGAVEPGFEAFYARVDASEREAIERSLAHTIKTGSIHAMEHSLILPEDRQKPVYCRAEVVYDPATGVPLKLVGTLQDISERKKAQARLQRAHDELKTLFNNTQEVFYSVDMQEYKLLHISASCRIVYGYSEHEFAQNPNLWLEVILPEDKTRIFANNEAMYSGRFFSHDYRIRHKDGSIRWLESRLNPTLNAKGELIRLDGTTADITKRKEAELALKDSETKFRYLIDNCSDAILIRNEHKEIVYCSDSVYGVIGYNAEEVIGKQTLNDIYPDDLQMVLSHWDKVLESPGIPITITYRRIHKDGRLIWCEGTSTNMLHQPEIRGVVVNFRDITEMKEAELALISSESKFRHMISYGADTIMIMDKDHKAVFLSDSFEKTTGFTAAEILGKATGDAMHPDDRERMAEHWKILESNPGKPLQVTYRRLKKDGSYIWCEGTGINLLHTPEVSGFLLNFRDITERKRAEAALQSSEDKFRSLIEHSSDALMILDKEGRTVYASDSVYRVMGYAPNEIIGAKATDFVYDADRYIVAAANRKVWSNPGQPSTIAYRRVKKDGTVIWCEGTATNLLHEPAVAGVVVNFRDITDRKNIEIALRNSEYKYRSLFENSVDAVIVIDESWDITYASESLNNILGYSPAEVSGITPDKFVHPEDLAEVLAQRKLAMVNHSKQLSLTERPAHRRVRKDGTVIWCEGTITNLLADPAVSGLVINFRDITDRKNSEDALKRSNEELQKSNAELDRFVYSVSHDLRAPLTSMLGLTFIAQNETTDANMLDYLDMLQSSIAKLDGFIHDILDHSRNARLEVKHELINFSELLADITANLRFMNPDTPVAIRTVIDENEAYYSDKSRMGIILNNLVSNAIRYYNPEMKCPEVQIDIKNENGKIRLSVRDNGIGIGTDQQEKVFDMFYRVSHKSTGSGLGLYIVKEAVDKLGGEVALESELGVGTHFTVLIPNVKSS
ncbi:PAS domain-containing protein [Polluticoccus soli]|uniref:PAS domain-containing protein n=1 Tax=Polluticoccus soli TaxID=3034150 RepID=UPI0023E0AE16|nr:PAS domain S-box protein [Flavipsychrobacter sp. JY13-12]